MNSEEIQESCNGDDVMKQSHLGEIHGFFSAKHPLLGTFKHAPSANNAGSKYFEGELIPMNEHIRRKELRNNPFTGHFHRGPNIYSELHNLSRFKPKFETGNENSSSKVNQHKPRIKTKLNGIHSRAPSHMLGNRRRSLSPRKFASVDDTKGKLVWETKEYTSDRKHRKNRKSQIYTDTNNKTNSQNNSRRIDFKQTNLDQNAMEELAQRWSYIDTPKVTRNDSISHRSVNGVVNSAKKERHYSMECNHIAENETPVYRERSHTSPALLSADNTLLTPPKNMFSAFEGASENGALESSDCEDPNGEPAPKTPNSTENPNRMLTLDRIAQIKARALHKRMSRGILEDQNPWVVNTSTNVKDKYEFVDNGILGGGTYSQVKTVKHKGEGTYYALKVVKKRYLIAKEEKEMIQREVEIHQVLRHPHIVRLCEIFENSSELYLVLQRANYGNLEQLMSNRPNLSETEACLIMRQLLNAVDYLHRNGVLQADIKPSNILLHRSSSLDDHDPFYAQTERIPVEELTVKLCDFGLSRKVPDVKYYKYTGDVHKVPYTEMRGTVGYIAPEILNEKPYGIAADMWSAGIIMYEMIGGMKPFLPYSDCLTTPVSFPEIIWKPKSSLCVDMLKKLLEVDTSKRMTATAALMDPWIQLCALPRT